MKLIEPVLAALVFAALLSPVAAMADAEADEIRSEFVSIINGLNDNSFDRFHRATVRKDLLARIYGSRIIEPDVKKAFAKDLSASIEQMYISSFPKSKKEILGSVVDFQLEGNEGRAVVRFAASGYRYVYHVYEFRLDNKGKLNIVDWIDYYQGSRFSDEAGEALVMAMPNKPATRKMLENRNLTEGQLFQMGELFKSVRDNKPDRFFQIYDGLDEMLLLEKVVIRLNLHVSLMARDSARAESAVQTLLDMYPEDPLYSLKLIEYYIPTRQYQEAIDAIIRLQNGLGIEDGATESLKASAALAMGNTADAEKYALQATVVEPSLELSWWSLLRAKTRSEDYSGVIAALTRLEDDFGHRLDPEQLKKDRFLRVLVDKQEYLDWRASRG